MATTDKTQTQNRAARRAANKAPAATPEQAPAPAPEQNAAPVAAPEQAPASAPAPEQATPEQAPAQSAPEQATTTTTTDAGAPVAIVGAIVAASAASVAAGPDLAPFTGVRENPALTAWVAAGNDRAAFNGDPLSPDYRKWLRAREKARAASKTPVAVLREYLTNRKDQIAAQSDEIAHWTDVRIVTRGEDGQTTMGATIADLLARSAGDLALAIGLLDSLPAGWTPPARPASKTPGKASGKVEQGAIVAFKATVAGDYAEDLGVSDAAGALAARMTVREIKGSRVKVAAGERPAFWVPADAIKVIAAPAPVAAPAASTPAPAPAQ